ncbi:response regulator transcription factor [Glaciimonas soli]|uniref:Response regulator n=1 Tax=Glaciimonas soli TaxID=2590999 RepID=A0A843YZQ1_9BURK|nr:response regulator [Glaciimonas soli]MQR02791.1 response regulator [Glaciimonas soli]
MYRFAIIEDLTPTNDEFKGFLLKSRPDCSVKQFFSFDTAIVAIKNEEFDLIVSDIDLGADTDKMGGVKIAKALDSQKTPLLIVSGSPQPEIQREVFRALDAWDYLQKPITEADFITQVKRAIAFRTVQAQKQDATVRSDGASIADADLVINYQSRNVVKWKNQRVNLSITQIRLVQEMVSSKNNTVSFAQLFEQIDTGRNKENLRVHIAAIRDAFKDVDSTFDRIKTTPMIGYFWRAD